MKSIKRVGLGLLPSKSWQLNAAWVLAATLATDLDAWTRLLLLHDKPDLAKAEPETIRRKIYHLPARLHRPLPTPHPAPGPVLAPGQRLSPPPGNGPPNSRPSPEDRSPPRRGPGRSRQQDTEPVELGAPRGVTRRPTLERPRTNRAASRVDQREHAADESRLMPSSSATPPAGLPVSTTIRTAPPRNSASYGGFFLDPMNPNFPCNHGLPATRGWSIGNPLGRTILRRRLKLLPRRHPPRRQRLHLDRRRRGTVISPTPTKPSAR